MKKLSLKNLNFGANDLLERQELKTVVGGYNYPCYDTGCMTSCHDQATFLLNNSSMTDSQVVAWVNACMTSCCNG